MLPYNVFSENFCMIASGWLVAQDMVCLGQLNKTSIKNGDFNDKKTCLVKNHIKSDLVKRFFFCFIKVSFD